MEESNEVNLSLFDNSWYKVGGCIKIAAWYIVNLLLMKNRWSVSSSLKAGIIRMFGGEVGKRVMIKPGINIKYPWLLKIGDNVWIGEGVWIDNISSVIIEDNVCISQGALLLCGNHNYKKKSFDLIVGDIKIEKGAWVGAKATVCPGVTLHSHSVLTVGSVATGDLDPYSIYSGVPAKFIRKRIVE